MTDSAIRFLSHRIGPVLLVVIVLAGCGEQLPSDSGQTSTKSGPVATRSSTPTPAPAATPSRNAAGIPDDFPLAQGLSADGDTTVSTPRRDVKGVHLDPRCWGHVWPGAAVDRLVVQQVGPELGVTRELAVYPDARTAVRITQRISADTAHCRRLPGTPGQPAMDVTRFGGAGAGVTRVAASFAETMTGGQPSGEVFVFTRVGRAILAVEDSGEWTRDSAVSGARDLRRAQQGVVSRLCLFRDTGC
jgi:hypothetical protein